MNKYFKKYLKVAPFALAIWRAQEANAINTEDLKSPLLDIGCGFGEFAGVFFNKTIEIGIDIDAKNIVLAAQKKRYKRLILCDARKLPFNNNSFKTIISISVLEHISNVSDVFFEAYRVLKPNGKFIFTVPTSEINSKFIMPKVLRKLGFNLLADVYLKTFHKVFKHKVVISKEKWLKLAKKANFKIDFVQGSITQTQLNMFEFSLPFALLTEIPRLLFKKRLLFSPNLRIKLIEKFFNIFLFLKDKKYLDANIVIIAKKSR